MIANKLSLTKNQINSFDRFLVASTGKVLNVLETVFALNIDSSDSSIEIVPTVNIEKIKHLSSGPLCQNGPSPQSPHLYPTGEAQSQR